MASEIGHPYPPGTRVRHYGAQFTTKAFATVVENKGPYDDGSFEYLIAVDDDAPWMNPGTSRWWSSRAAIAS